MAITSEQQHFLESFLANNPSYQSGIFDIYQPEWQSYEMHAPVGTYTDPVDEYTYGTPQFTSTRRTVPAFSTIKSYAEDLNEQRSGEGTEAGTYGYTDPSMSTDIFIKDIEKFGPAWGPSPTEQGLLNAQVAGTIGHEYGHQTLANDPRFSDIKEMVLGNSLSGGTYKDYLESGIQGLGTKKLTNELFNRLIDLRHSEDLEGPESRRDIRYIQNMLQGDWAGTDVPWQNIANPHLRARPMLMEEFFKLMNPAQMKYMDRVKKIQQAEAMGGGVSNINIQKAKMGMPEHLTPPPKQTYVSPARPHGNGGGGPRPDKPGGFTDPGKGSYGPHKAHGGLIDTPLSGRSRYL